MDQGSPKQSHPALSTTSHLPTLGHCPEVTKPTSKAKLGSVCHRALLRHRCAPAMSPLETETYPLPNHLRGPCSAGTAHLQPGQHMLTVANSLNMFSRGQAQQLCVCVCVWHIRFRGVAFLHPFPSTDLGGVGQAAVQARRSGQDAKPAPHTCKDK